MSDDSERLMRVENKVSDHGDRLARIETKLDAMIERQKRWGAVWPAIVSAITSGIVLGVFKLLTQATQ